MKIYHTISPHETIHGLEFHMYTVVLKLNNGNILTCHNFPKYEGKLDLLVWLAPERKWFKISMRSENTQIMFAYHKKMRKKLKSKINCNALMKHDRKHKHGSGASRICNRSITDYECCKNPMHDFHRSMYVQWN